MKRFGEPIHQLELKHKLSTGITIEGLPGIVPEFYEISACNAANYQFFHNWQELDQEQKAKLVAHYYGDIMVNAHKDDAMNDKMKKDSRKRGVK